MQLILEAEGLGSVSLAQKVSALQIRGCLDLNSKASAAPTQVWCLKGVGRVSGRAIVNKKPESN